MSERGVYGPSTEGRTIGTGAKIGFAVGFGFIIVGLVGSVVMDLGDNRNRREQITEAGRRRARISARAWQGSR